MTVLARLREFATRYRLGHWLLRWFCFAMAAVHVWPIILISLRLLSGYGTAMDVFSLLTLVVVTVGFALKAGDAAFLRFERPWAAMLVVMIIAGIAHHDVLPREGVGPIPVDTTVALVTSLGLIAGGLALLGLRSLRGRFALPDSSPNPARLDVGRWVLLKHRCLAGVGCISERGPPAVD